MALKTAGTLATTTLQGQQANPSVSAISAADMAAIANAIFKQDDSGSNVFGVVAPGSFSSNGLLYIPNRGVLRVLPGDWVLVGADGWPILVPDDTLPGTLTATGTPASGSPVLPMTVNVMPLGWGVGTLITGTGLAASTFIKSFSVDGKTITMTKNATSSPGATTITAGTYTHS